MEQFIEKHGASISGVLSGWDRLVFRGAYRILCAASGMMEYLWHVGVLLKHFGDHAERMTRTLLDASLAAAEHFDRPVIYLPSSSEDKEEVAARVLRERPIESGLICVLKCVEPCMTYEIHRNRERKELELRGKQRKCLHLYHYFVDTDFGFMNARIQTWLPFSVQICLNGREWLARSLDEAGIAYERYDNAFTWIADFAKAQQLMDRQIRVHWPGRLDRIAQWLNPAAETMFADFPVAYYWTGYQTEWATDVAFRKGRALAAIYPQLAWGAMTAFSSSDVLRFLGRPWNSRFAGEVTSDFKDRPEGRRVRHAVNGNSVKMYDKGPNLLRIETTVNNPRDLKVYRTSERDPQGARKWLRMRKGVADLRRRAEVSQNTNKRYLDALANIDTTTRIQEILGPISRRRTRRGRTVRALRLWTVEDQALLEAIQRPEYLLAGFRNANLARVLYADLQNTPEAKRRAAARISYRLRLLRTHGLIAKLSHTRRYRITSLGQQVVAAAIITQNVTIHQLIHAVA